MVINGIVILILSVQFVLSHNGWIDPHDMNIKDSRSTGLDSNEHCSAQLQCECSSKTKDNTLNYKGRLYLDIPPNSYQSLKEFTTSSSEEDPAILRGIDQILSKVLIKPSSERVSELFMSWSDYVYFTFYNRTTGILMSCLFVLFISYKLLKANLTLWSVMKYLLFLGWVTDFAFTWINLLQEAEINKLADTMKYGATPGRCDVNKMTTWEYIKYSLGSMDDCRKYHQTLYKDHFWSIAPVTVFSHQFGILILTPARHMGQAIGSFSSEILGSLPWGVNIILLPVLLIFSLILLCIMFSFVTNTSFGFSFFHIFQLKFGNEQRHVVGDMLTGRNLAALLHIADHRNMVEDVRGSERTITSQPIAECSNGPVSEKKTPNPPTRQDSEEQENVGSVKNESQMKTSCDSQDINNKEIQENSSDNNADTNAVSNVDR